MVIPTCTRMSQGKIASWPSRPASWIDGKRAWKQKEGVPKHALKLEEVKELVTILSNYTEKNAILLPGRYGYKRDDLQQHNEVILSLG